MLAASSVFMRGVKIIRALLSGTSTLPRKVTPCVVTPHNGPACGMGRINGAGKRAEHPDLQFVAACHALYGRCQDSTGAFKSNGGAHRLPCSNTALYQQRYACGITSKA